MPWREEGNTCQKPDLDNRNERTQPSFIIWLKLSCVALVALNLFWISKGRTNYIIVPAALGCAAMFRLSWKWLTAAVLTAAILLVGLFFVHESFNQRLCKIPVEIKAFMETGETNSSVGTRLGIYRAAMITFSEDPIFGAGTATIRESNMKHASLRCDSPHSEYLNALMQHGLVGLAVLLSWFASQFYFARYIPQPRRTLGLMVTMIALTFSITFSGLSINSTSTILMLMIALSFAVDPLPPEHEQAECTA